jgi:hypothetical protein
MEDSHHRSPRGLSCPETRELLAAHALGAAGADALAVEAHLARCACGSGELAANDRVVAALLPAVPVPARVWDAVAAHL